MSALILDIETVPQAIGYLEAAMPEDLRSPVPPEPEPERDWEAACPKYSSDKDREAKRAAWIAEKRKAWAEDNEALKTKWHADMEAKRKAFLENAALDARLCHVKLIGLHDTENEVTEVFAFENDAVKFQALAKAARARNVMLHCSRHERDILAHFFRALDSLMEDADRTLVTFYGNTFDIPLLYRRAWITGAGVRCKWKRGRYLDPRFVDLHDEYTFGDRGVKTGGLDALAASLGCEARKTGDGARFGEWYEKDPGEGLAYLLNDLAVTRECAQKMGVAR